MVSAKLASGLVAIAITLMVPALGRAQTCTSDADCSKGLRCSADPMATPPVAICYDGDARGACTPADQPAPTPTTSCQAAPCVSDADCGTDMVCHQQIKTTCTGVTPVAVKCDPTTGCDAGPAPVPEPVTCTDTVAAKCAYKWEQPCNADADCGSNFTCQPTTVGTCSGSSGTASAGAGGTSAGAGGGTGTAAPVPPANDLDGGSTIVCTTTSSYPGHCLAKTITCTATADCPAGWACAATSTGTAVGGVATTAGGLPASGPVPPDAGVAIPPPVATVSTCQPPSTQGTYGNRGGTDTTQGTGTISLAADAGAKGSSTPPTPSVPSPDGGATQEQTPARTASGGGCSLAGAPDGAFWLLGLLGVVALIRLRRR